jgi:hypothetical protein
MRQRVKTKKEKVRREGGRGRRERKIRAKEKHKSRHSTSRHIDRKLHDITSLNLEGFYRMI